jgi:hypothetical protein
MTGPTDGAYLAWRPFLAAARECLRSGPEADISASSALCAPVESALLVSVVALRDRVAWRIVRCQLRSDSCSRYTRSRARRTRSRFSLGKLRLPECRFVTAMMRAAIAARADSLCDWLRALLSICRSGCAIVDEGPTGRAVT